MFLRTGSDLDLHAVRKNLVAVRQMRRTFEKVRGVDPAVEAYVKLYDALLIKLHDMTTKRA